MAKLKSQKAMVNVASSNQEESDTLKRYWLGLVDLENKVVCAKPNDTDVFTIMLGKYEKLNGSTLIIAWSIENWIN